MPRSLLFFNGNQINIIVLHQPHFSACFSDISNLSVSGVRKKQLPCFQHEMTEMRSHSVVDSIKAKLVPALCGNRMIQAPAEGLRVFSGRQSQSDQWYMLCSFPFHNLVPGSNTIHTDMMLNTDFEKWSCESLAVSNKQDSICPLKEFIMINSETRAAASRLQTLGGARKLSITCNSASTPQGYDVTVPDYDVIMMEGSCTHDIIENDCENCPNKLCNNEEIPTVPESPRSCKSGLLSSVSCMDTRYQDSAIADTPSNSPVNDSYCFTQYCFMAEKDSLIDEDSDYELDLSPTQESYSQLQQDILVIDAGQGTCDASHHDVIISPAESITDVINTPVDTGGLADDGGATLLQNLPLEMAKQTDTEKLQVCREATDSADNTDYDFNGTAGRTQGITCSELPNQKIVNLADDLQSNSPTIESGKCFTIEQYNCYDHDNNGNLQAVPSCDQTLGDDGPSKLLMTMDLLERKDHHVPDCLNRRERICGGSYYGKPHQ